VEIFERWRRWIGESIRERKKCIDFSYINMGNAWFANFWP
jgi:hypothetical protein